jgi:hypothetical protein
MELALPPPLTEARGMPRTLLKVTLRETGAIVHLCASHGAQ